MLLFGGKRKGGAILAAKVYLAGFSTRKVLHGERQR